MTQHHGHPHQDLHKTKKKPPIQSKSSPGVSSGPVQATRPAVLISGKRIVVEVSEGGLEIRRRRKARSVPWKMLSEVTVLKKKVRIQMRFGKVVTISSRLMDGPTRDRLVETLENRGRPHRLRVKR